MRKILVGLLCLCLLFSGCGKGNSESANSFPIDESKAKMAQSLDGYTASINGKVFNFPLAYSSFATLGFELGPNLKNATLKAGQYSIYKVSSGEYNTEVYIANLGDKEKELGDCTVCGVVDTENSNALVKLPLGVVKGMTQSEVENKYGDASKTSDADFDTILTYGTELEGAKFKLKKDKLCEIYYYRIVNPEDLEFSKEPPQEVKKYKDPEMLSSKLSDFTFYLYGTTYTMPLPVSRMIEAGWIKVAQKEEYIPANKEVEDAVKLTAANRTLTLGVKNVAPYPTSVENCYVTSIKSTTDVKLDLTLANGCRVGTTAYNLENTFGKENFTSIDKKGKNTIYTYIHKGKAKLTVTSSNETGYITEIKIELL